MLKTKRLSFESCAFLMSQPKAEKRTSECTVEGSGKKPKVMAPSDIKSANDFHAVCPQHRIYPRNCSFVSSSEWNTKAGSKDISEWLKIVAVDQIRMYQQIEPKTEASLYPLILTTLLPIFDLCDCDVVGNVVGEVMGEEDRERLVSEIVQSQSLASFRQASVESACRTGGSYLMQTDLQ